MNRDFHEPLRAKAGLYVHVPFCSSVCPYCDFAVTLAGEDRRAQWEKNLLAEATMYADHGFEFDTVYFGGGTPSALKVDRLARIVGGLRSILRIDDSAQFFIEVNPEDVTPDLAQSWRDLGFSTVSVGVQSFDDLALEFLGRHHTKERAQRSVAALLKAGFSTVSLDLIFGLPNQDQSDWTAQLHQAVGLGVHHLSCYQLTIHGGTIFGKRRERGLLQEMKEGPQADLYAVTHQALHAEGFEGYEVSNFCKPGHRSAHNSKYWNGAPYLGLGPGAHSFDGEGKRWWNRRKVRLWQRDIGMGCFPVDGGEDLTVNQRALETLMLGLRMSDGVDLRAVERRYRLDVVQPNRVTLRALEAEGLIKLRGDVVSPTPAGMAVADSLARAIKIEVS